MRSVVNLTAWAAVGNNRPAASAAEAIHAAYERWLDGFREVTLRARARFEARDWWGAQADAAERLELYRVHLDAAVSDTRDILQDAVMARPLWARIRAAHAERSADRPDAELAETFFNSVTRKVFSTVGADPAIEYAESRAPSSAEELLEYETYVAPAAGPELARRILDHLPLSVPFAQLERDAERVAAIMEARVREVAGGVVPVEVDVLRAVFYRNKGAYLVGRLRAGGHLLPLVVPLLHAERGIVVDAVLMTQDEVSVVFGFSWLYFRVEAPRPRALVSFLASIMPNKRIDELYTAIGYNKHGKTELYRTLTQHLGRPDATFAFAEGEEGLVMAVFTLPTFNVVFKIIKDTFTAPKNTTRRAVMEKYHFVFVRDRVGRLADAQEFEHLDFPRRCFPEDLLGYLTSVAGETVRPEGDRVVIRHLYIERRVTPLNLYVRTAPLKEASRAVLDYGTAIKDLAAADIFTGDMLLKNFGVTRNGRVICYDYDELALLSECRFRRIPPSRNDEDEYAAEPWFAVADEDVFPEEFRAFLVPSGELRDAFLEHHGDLLGVEFWQTVQRRLSAGEVFDVFPYTRSPALARNA
ncbi:MAG: bifunctional isocitrate dehydrogenase kinase/phosphatase [Gemmatimonadales bacterium]|nr:bifunctional isocitrate dehydrogenase kinase/phosphatase [Gemmatimonadales bacterium]